MINRIVSVSILILFFVVEQASGSIRIKAVFFDEGDTTLRFESTDLLDSLIFHYSEILEECPALIIKLSCNSDSYECKKKDTLLSYERGLVVKNYLVHHGIDQSRLIIKAHGGNEPLCLEKAKGKDNPDCKQLNRRVEITIDRCKD